MHTYRKKPKQVQAWQLTPENVSNGLPDCFDKDIVRLGWNGNDPNKTIDCAIIENPNQKSRCALIGDWILKHEDGIYSIMKAGEFSEEYEIWSKE